MLIIRDIASYDELKSCVYMSCGLCYDPLFPYDVRYALKNLFNVMQQKQFFKVITEDDEIVSWGCASVNTPYLHSREKELGSIYYQTKLKGIRAVKSLKLYHESMVEFATINKVPKCTSSSIMETQDTFYKVLEKAGWIRRGCIMVYLLDSRDSTVSYNTQCSQPTSIYSLNKERNK